MKLLMVILVRNEEDIIEENIVHHLNQGVDKIVALDNLSTDGTTDILRKFEKKGYLDYHRIDEDGYRQQEWVNEFAKRAAINYTPSWIFCNDADELFFPPRKEISLADYLSTIDGVEIIEVYRKNVICSLESILEGGDWKQTLRFCAKPVEPQKMSNIYEEAFQHHFFYWKLPPKTIFKPKRDFYISKGAHTIDMEGAKSIAGEAYTLHFPIRSVKEFADSILNIGKVVTKDGSPPMQSWKYKRWYYLIQSGGIMKCLQDSLPNEKRLRADLESGFVVNIETPFVR